MKCYSWCEACGYAEPNVYWEKECPDCKSLDIETEVEQEGEPDVYDIEEVEDGL